ncbi:MAG TPA: dinitrogenase iron-molybdenum cofactor biosynthesis protein [Myxococcales bacterium]|jgi:predicted Fe-Mo cluster-binding NifX family protein|nr:dinitrogenase iron-molybdenum cofactor biosynthesis protein [Myxococcales bacterium]
MRVCVPTNGKGGVTEEVCEHFGCAPFFTVVDTADGSVSSFENPNKEHAFGHCNPDASFAGQSIDALVLPKVSARVAIRLHEMGIRVYLSTAGRVNEVVELLQAGKLKFVKIMRKDEGEQPGA